MAFRSRRESTPESESSRPANHHSRPASSTTGGFNGRAAYTTGRGGPGVLVVRDRYVPDPGPGEVVVEIHAAGVAFGDQMLREGLRPDAQPPSIPGYDAAGVVVATGPGVEEVQVGAHVAVWTGGTGGYATYISAPAWAVVEYPAGLGAELVASLILNYLTAYQLLTRAAPVADGATVLIHPAGGNVGTALLELGALRSLRMLGTGGASRADRIHRLGGEPIDYRADDYARRVRVEAPDGVDVIFDAIGGGSWRKSLPLLRADGHLVIYGVTESIRNGRRNLAGLLTGAIQAPRTSYLTYFQRGVGVSGYRIDQSVPAHHDWYREDLEAVLHLLRDGKISPSIHRTFALDQVADAHRELGTGHTTGKILLLPNGDRSG